jgi:integrin alpha FG-GAP repeat containing protein 1
MLSRSLILRTKAYVRFPLSDLLPGSLVVQDPTFSIGGSPLHVPIRLGDADVDGFPEMLLTVYSTDSHNAGRTSPVLVSNVPCTSADIAGCGGKVDTTRRGWQVLQLGTQVLSGVSDARSAAFIDIDEDVSFRLARIGRWR